MTAYTIAPGVRLVRTTNSPRHTTFRGKIPPFRQHRAYLRIVLLGLERQKGRLRPLYRLRLRSKRNKLHSAKALAFGNRKLHMQGVFAEHKIIHIKQQCSFTRLRTGKVKARIRKTTSAGARSKPEDRCVYVMMVLQRSRPVNPLFFVSSQVFLSRFDRTPSSGVRQLSPLDTDGTLKSRKSTPSSLILHTHSPICLLLGMTDLRIPSA